MIGSSDIRSFIAAQNLGDSVLCLHSSFKSFGSVEGGPDAMIDAFLDSGATLLCPSFFYNAETYPKGTDYARNGIDFSKMDYSGAVSFEDGPDQIDPSMGLVPRTLVRNPWAIRGRNPHDSFVAVGPEAQELMKGQDLLNVYSAYKNLHRRSSGDRAVRAFVVLAGVSLDSCTPLHYAEELAGRSLFRRWALYGGKKVEVETGSCSDGFEKLAPFAARLERRAVLGASTVRIYPFAAFVETMARTIAARPEITACSDLTCLRCRDMVAGGRGGPL